MKIIKCFYNELPLYDYERITTISNNITYYSTRIRKLLLIYPLNDTGHVMAWDFTESSFRPSVNLKATHSKLTSMEFLTGN
jgi:hypothetical protein